MPAPVGNKYAIGNKGGKPPFFKSAKALIKKVNEYFIYIQGEYEYRKIGKKTERICIRESEPATVTGLTLFLGFANRQSLTDYKDNEEYADIIKKAKALVEHEYEKKLTTTTSAAGPIFALKNMGWNDKQELQHTGAGGKDLAFDITLNIK